MSDKYLQICIKKFAIPQSPHYSNTGIYQSIFSFSPSYDHCFHSLFHFFSLFQPYHYCSCLLQLKPFHRVHRSVPPEQLVIFLARFSDKIPYRGSLAVELQSVSVPFLLFRVSFKNTNISFHALSTKQNSNSIMATDNPHLDILSEIIVRKAF
jgi:hypothetical protein